MNEIDLNKLSNMSSAEIGNILDEIDKEMIEKNKLYGQLKDDLNKIRKNILLLEIQKNDLKVFIGKHSENMRRLELQKDLCQRAFWTAKKSGL